MSIAMLSRSTGLGAVAVTDWADLKKQVKALQWAVADLAVEYLRIDHAASYAEAAALFRIGVHQLRGRVEYRFGSVENLRSGYIKFSPIYRAYSIRKCMRCGLETRIADGFRMCGKCKA